MPRPAHALLTALLASGLAGSAAAQAGAPDPHSERLEELAEEILITPNDPTLHLEVAKSYYQRGAEDDANRVRVHLGRATQLDPGLERKAERLFDELQSGNRFEPLTSDELRIDYRISRAVPSANEAGGEHRIGWENTIQVGLAERMVERDLSEKVTSFEEATAEFSEVFEWNQQQNNSNVDWSSRLGALERRQAPEGWEGRWQQAVQSAAGRMQEDVPPVEIGEEEIPDPMTRKNEAIRAFQEGETEEAITGLVEAVAAAEVRKNIANSPVEDALVEGDSEGAEEGFLGDPAQANPFAGSENTAPGPEAPPAQAAGPRPRPDLDQQVSQASLEALEAIANEEVPPAEVERKVAEAAAVGAVGDPLLLDLDRDGKPGLFTGLLPDGVFETAHAVTFDLNADGFAERTEWIRPGSDGLLAVDLDGDGTITSGLELFGNHGGARHGFARLALFDIDGDGWVSGAEATGLRVWRDDGDAICQPGELSELSRWGIEALSAKPDGDGVGAARTARGTLAVWDWMPDIRLQLKQFARR